MSILNVGSLSARLTGPHVYFICARDLLYIGETQKHPVIRWSDHLSLRGSFRAAVVSRGFSDLGLDEQIHFHAYQLAESVAAIPEVQIKQATQAVEHELHVLLRARPSLLGGGLAIISDTEKTAPRTFKHWALAQGIAKAIAGEFATALTGKIAWPQRVF
jgi:hypothetical protein